MARITHRHITVMKQLLKFTRENIDKLLNFWNYVVEQINLKFNYLDSLTEDMFSGFSRILKKS